MPESMPFHFLPKALEQVGEGSGVKTPWALILVSPLLSQPPISLRNIGGPILPLVSSPGCGELDEMT